MCFVWKLLRKMVASANISCHPGENIVCMVSKNGTSGDGGEVNFKRTWILPTMPPSHFLIASDAENRKPIFTW